MGGIGREDAPLALKVPHYIQEVSVHVRFIVKLHLDRVQVAQRVRHIEQPISPIAVALSSVGSSNSGVPPLPPFSTCAGPSLAEVARERGRADAPVSESCERSLGGGGGASGA